MSKKNLIALFIFVILGIQMARSQVIIWLYIDTVDYVDIEKDRKQRSIRNRLKEQSRILNRLAYLFHKLTVLENQRKVHSLKGIELVLSTLAIAKELEVEIDRMLNEENNALGLVDKIPLISKKYKGMADSNELYRRKMRFLEEIYPESMIVSTTGDRSINLNILWSKYLKLIEAHSDVAEHFYLNFRKSYLIDGYRKFHNLIPAIAN